MPIFDNKDIDWSAYAGYAKFTPTIVYNTLMSCRNQYILIVTGNRLGKCVTKDTRIDTPDGEIPVGELFAEGKDFLVYAWDGQKKVVARAKTPFIKEGLHFCYRITMSDRRIIEAADHHRILTTYGEYETVEEIFDFSPVPMCIEKTMINGIVPIGYHEVYDFEVADFHNYFAGGLIHHNTMMTTRKRIDELMGLSPIPQHNVRQADIYRVYRFAAENLPNDKEHEVRNTVYPFIKSQLPTNMIKKDITARDATMTVLPLMGGDPAQLECVSYGQSTMSQAGVDRRGINVDEVCNYAFYEESLPRLATSFGQMLIGCTPVEAGWMYTEIYERAKVYYRTKAVRDFMKKEMGETVKAAERTDSRKDIAVIQAASDDNPIFERLVKEKLLEVKLGHLRPDEFPYANVSEYLDSIFMYDDKDTVAMRRYGIFKQITGAIHKEFNWNIHMIDGRKYFPYGLPYDCVHARMIDYHQSVPWAVNWILLTKDNEAFIYDEFNPDPHTWTTLGICKEMAERSRDYKFSINLIDPLSAQKQVNTNTSCLDDINHHFREMRACGLGTGGYWEGWDTRGTKGEDAVRERLINAKICGRPFNNLQMVDGKPVRLPTLWFFDHCKETGKSHKNWKQEQWLDRNAQVTKDQKDSKEQKWSHFCMTLEAIFKDSRFRGTPHEYRSKRDDFTESRYFKGRRRG